MKQIIMTFPMIVMMSGFCLADDAPEDKKPDDSSVLVETMPVTTKILAETMPLYGVVAVDSRHSMTISFPQAGQIKALLVSSGQSVKRGDALLEFITSPDTTSNYHQSVTALDLAKSELQRTADLLSQHLATAGQLAAAQKAYDDATNMLSAQKKMGAGISSRRMTAPYDAIVMTVSTAPGDHIAAGAPIMVLADSKHLVAEFGAEPSDLKHIKAGMGVRLTSVTDDHLHAEGAVIDVQSSINPVTQLVTIRVELSDTHFLFGSAIKGDLILRQASEIAVPENAVLTDEKGSYIFQNDSGKARRINIKTDIADEGMVGISGDINHNQPIITSGNYELQDGMKIRGANP